MMELGAMLNDVVSTLVSKDSSGSGLVPDEGSTNGGGQETHMYDEDHNTYFVHHCDEKLAILTDNLLNDAPEGVLAFKFRSDTNTSPEERRRLVVVLFGQVMASVKVTREAICNLSARVKSNGGFSCSGTVASSYDNVRLLLLSSGSLVRSSSLSRSIICPSATLHALFYHVVVF